MALTILDPEINVHTDVLLIKDVGQLKNAQEKAYSELFSLFFSSLYSAQSSSVYAVSLPKEQLVVLIEAIAAFIVILLDFISFTLNF